MLALASGSVTFAIASEEAAQFPANETLRHFRSLNDPQLSPDGTRALLRVDDGAADGGGPIGTSHAASLPTCAEPGARHKPLPRLLQGRRCARTHEKPEPGVVAARYSS